MNITFLHREVDSLVFPVVFIPISNDHHAVGLTPQPFDSAWFLPADARLQRVTLLHKVSAGK
ncbi:MAG: hypothetical protein H6555_00640 [Lewinellaceae bacterium]|nr:hypothetical protein [Lewinellaceae bacterium]